MFPHHLSLTLLALQRPAPTFPSKTHDSPATTWTAEVFPDVVLWLGVQPVKDAGFVVLVKAVHPGEASTLNGVCRIYDQRLRLRQQIPLMNGEGHSGSM